MSIPVLNVEFLDKSRLPKKRRRFSEALPTSLAPIPAEWRELLLQWVRLGGNSRWDTLIKKAGVDKKSTAETLLNWLLDNGWAYVNEERKHGDWWPYHLELREIKALRSQLNLPDVDAVAMQWQSVRASLQSHVDDCPALFAALSALDAMPVSRAIVRATLVLSLLNWQKDERVGTYRDFSLFARAATKEISKTEWDWLDAHFDLAEFNIEQHTPLLLISASIILHTKVGGINLGAMPDFCALTPATVNNIQGIQGQVSTWFLIENRTSFERVARNRQLNEGVIWLPGYPPSWWTQALSCLIEKAPAPAKIACDPDPSGVAIALTGIHLFQTLGQTATAWKMDIALLKDLNSQKSLSDFDNQQLSALLTRALPDNLRDLAEYMQLHQVKGEQEGYL